MKNRIVVMIMAAALSLPAMAGWITQEQKDATVQQSAFQSTSTMAPSGSAYSSNPTLDDNGSASSPNQGPRRSKMDISLPPTPTVDENDTGNQPIGDAVLPLLLFAAAAAGVIALRRRKTTVDCRQ